MVVNRAEFERNQRGREVIEGVVEHNAFFHGEGEEGVGEVVDFLLEKMP